MRQDAGPEAKGDLLIASLSGRALAASARAAGYRPLVADLFADADLRDFAADCRMVPGGVAAGFDGPALLGALEALAGTRDPVGIVCGTGFEDRPELLEAIAGRWRLLGNRADTIRTLKDPIGFAALCARLAIPHPETRLDPPEGERKGWLTKRAGASGGLHIRFAGPDHAPEPCRYHQRLTDGDRRSALFLAGGGKAVILGFSEQWPSPCGAAPFRYGGACGPIRPGAAAEAGMRRAVEAIAAALPALAGLGSADFLVPVESEPVLLEINPRPGATVDVFDRPERPLLALHVEACAGRLPRTDEAPPDAPVRAAGFAYLDNHPAVTIGAVDWPRFVMDRPTPGTVIRRGEPLCTLTAEGADADAAITLFGARLASVAALIEDDPA